MAEYNSVPIRALYSAMYHQRFKTEAERFNEKFDVLTNGCWQWRAKSDYPKFLTACGYVRASRYAWQLANGTTLSRDQHVCHMCDNPRCVNPEHLFAGSHLDNMRDKAAKGRSARTANERNGRAKLNSRAAEEIRRSYATGSVSQDALAKAFGVAQVTISRVVRMVHWAEKDG